MIENLRQRIIMFFSKDWISVKRRLPETDILFDRYFIFDTINNKVLIDRWNNETNEWNHYGKKVIYWRELPPELKKKK